MRELDNGGSIHVDNRKQTDWDTSNAQRVLGPPRANPPGVWVLNLRRNRMRGTRRAPRREVDEKPLRHTGRVCVRIPSFVRQFLPTCDRMSCRACLAIHRERAGCVVADSA